jgi:site-specific DNA-methyltransferase (adenine-specific)
MDLWLHQGDAIEWLKTLPDESVDCVNTDIAYESLEKHRKVGTTTRLKVSNGSSNEWFEIFRNTRFPELFRECYRVLKRDRHFYFYCDQETMFIAKPEGEKAGFKFWKPLVWEKGSIGMGYHFRSRYEFILFFEKGKRKLNDLGIADVLPVKKIFNGYPTEKPVELNRILIEQSTQPGEIVIDPFMGSASSGEAALKTGRSYWGNDLSSKSLEVATARLSGYPGVKCLTALPAPPTPQTRLAL